LISCRGIRRGERLPIRVGAHRSDAPLQRRASFLRIKSRCALDVSEVLCQLRAHGLK